MFTLILIFKIILCIGIVLVAEGYNHQQRQDRQRAIDTETHLLGSKVQAKRTKIDFSEAPKTASQDYIPLYVSDKERSRLEQINRDKIIAKNKEEAIRMEQVLRGFDY